MKNRIFWTILIAVMFTFVSSSGWALSPPHNETNGIECRDCHHVRDNTYGFSRIVTFGKEQESMCKTCHNPTGMAAAMSEVSTHDVDAGATVVDCGSCHSVHATDMTTDPHTGGVTAPNLSLIRDDIDWYIPQAMTPAIFQSKPEHFSFTELPATGVCQTCHTQTSYYTNDGLNTGHYTGLYCTTCHTHDSGFMPQGGGCLDCHNQPQGNQRQIVGIGGDFQLNSHHVQGTIEDNDCTVCHKLASHGLGNVQLINVDTGSLYEELTLGSFRPGEITAANSKALRPFCLSCHDSDGVNGDITPFSDNVTVPNIDSTTWYASAHDSGGAYNTGYGCIGDGVSSGCHGNGHGSQNIKLLNAGAGVALQTFCYNCHTEGMVSNDALSNNRPGGYVSANDIEEAFSKSSKHNVGNSFTKSGNTFTIQCTSCHNPHMVTGKYWDAENGVTPVTRPDFSDPVNNPRAMGTTLWGDEPGEKMDDYAAQASGTGGWYYKIAQGYSLGNTGLPFDQPARYQPPKSGSGYEFEFDGDVLPDYNTICMDCHSSDMGGNTQGAINWNVQHGFSSANMSSYVSDSGTAGFWGSSGNADVAFQMNYVTRGRHNGHFMRWPYDSADRGAGINFLLACTDCHEAHGSNRGGMIRERFNVTSAGACGSGSNPGDGCTDGGNWNSFCNACHYYYGGQHAGMSCGNASCHLYNSLHRIDKGGGGGPTQLILTAAGYEGNYVRPAFTPEIEKVEGHIASDILEVTFRASQYGAGTPGIYANPDLTGTLTADDFWLFNGNGNGTQIVSVSHVAGAYSAIITMNQPLEAGDLSNDTLATTGKSVWAWYEGGYNNAATGVIAANVVSAGPWPVNITGPPVVRITAVDGLQGSYQILVTFSEGVFTNTGGTGALGLADFTLTDVGGNHTGWTIIDVVHSPGGNTAVLTLSEALVAGDINVATLDVADGTSIYDAYDNAIQVSPEPVAQAACPDWGSSFALNESAGSTTVQDVTGLLSGPVLNDIGQAINTLPGDGYFHGDEIEERAIDITSNNTCMKNPTTFTVEARVYTSVVDLDYVDLRGATVADPPNGQDDDYDAGCELDPQNCDVTSAAGDGRNITSQRITERNRTFQLTIFRANYAGDWDGANRAGKARVILKYRVDPASLHTCPYPSLWPDDTWVGTSAWMHQISTDIDTYPLVQGHWYQIRAVYNSNKLLDPGYSGEGAPVDIFIDDQGTDGVAEPNPGAGELWSGFRNASRTIIESSSCRWGAKPDDIVATEDQPLYIGDNVNHTNDIPGAGGNNLFKGLIDWVTWKSVADYTAEPGVTIDPPK